MKRKYKKTKPSGSQRGRFLNRYDFAYTGRDTTNTAISQLNRIPPGLITKIRSQLDQIADRRIKQAIQQSGKEINRVALKIIKTLLRNCTKLHFNNWIHSVAKSTDS